jgi:periplasmic divalent cation tolerance protein
MPTGIILLSTYPDEQTAIRAARKIVRSKLAACVSLTKVRSLYWWEEKIEDSNEYLAIFKSVKTLAKELRKAVAESHPYKVPEIVEIEMNRVSRGYLEWMVESVAA